ncbi:MAG: VWA domain-containing protein, partial [Verrucomicrobiales bacterium]|nr:VWA domain-containing protein [Verrucomicrobiales bacterium]
MDWQAPLWLPLGPVLVLLLVWVDQKSVHAMPVRRRKLLLLVRSLAVLAVVAALAGPVVETHSSRQAVGLVMDLSQSMGQDGLERVLNAERDLREGLPSTSEVFTVALGAQPTLWRPEDDAMNLARAWQIEHGADSDYAEALRFASALFPPGSGKNVVVLGDGTPTRGEMDRVARDLAADGILVHALAVAGEPRPDVRVAAFSAARTQVREGASVDLQAELRSTGAEVVRLRLFEDGLEVESRVLELPAGASQTVHFERTPSGRGLRAFRLVAEPTGADELPQNNEGLALVDVQGRLRWLAVTLDSDSVAGLQRAMAAEEVQVETVTPERAPRTMDQLAAYDGVILAAVPAHRLGEEWMKLLRDYVDRLGGGLLMLGDSQTFGVGGYFQTPVEEMLPVRLRAPDEEEKQSAAVALVIDRSGSMAGEKLETAKSAAMATAEVLDRMDYLGVFAFDSEGKVVVPMTRLTSKAAVAGQIATLSAGGGTNLEPALQMAREALGRVKARVKHIIVLTDGQTAGSGYENLASLCRAEGMTISTVAIGEGSHVALLQAMASAGGGQAYSTLDAAGITRIFTQDTLMHTSNLIREEPFEAQVAEPHPMISGLEKWNAPPLLGYVKTLRRAAAQVPLVTA